MIGITYSVDQFVKTTDKAKTVQLTKYSICGFLLFEAFYIERKMEQLSNHMMNWLHFTGRKNKLTLDIYIINYTEELWKYLQDIYWNWGNFIIIFIIGTTSKVGRVKTKFKLLGISNNNRVSYHDNWRYIILSHSWKLSQKTLYI